MRCLSKKNYNNKKIKKPSNIGIKVPDLEWETTGRNVRPPASNENPAFLPRPNILFPYLHDTPCQTF